MISEVSFLEGIILCVRNLNSYLQILLEVNRIFVTFELNIIPSVMAHHTEETSLSPAEREFIDLMQHGDDLLKIELLRPAKKWYQRALRLNMETKKVEQKIAECDRLLAFELKVIKILVAVTAVLILAFYLLK